MKPNICILFFLLISISLNSQNSKEQQIQSKVKSAVVFLKNAQVNREKTVALTTGENVLKFTNLSPFIDKKSIQIKAKDIEIKAINFNKNYLQNSKKNSEFVILEANLKTINNSISLKLVDLGIIEEEITFLKSNKTIGGNQTVTASEFKEAADFYGAKIKALKKSEFILKTALAKLKNEQAEIEKQLNDFSLHKNFGTGEIVIRLNSETTKKTKFILSYNVSNVGWYPTYDVRVKDINTPLELIYKANLYQNSKVDWTNVNLSFSSGNPTKSNKVKEVIPYFIGYGTQPPNYKNNFNSITGTVSSNGEPLPGATILIKGTTIGTTTDFDGNFTLETPTNNNKNLIISYLGFKTKEVLITNNVLNINLEEDASLLDEIVVVGYGTTKSKGSNKNRKFTNAHALSRAVVGVKIRGASSLSKRKKEIVSTLNTEQVVNQTSVNFKVIKPYTINSSSKNFSIPMKIYSIPTDYQYYTFPRAEESAFLIAKINDWEKFNLLEAEANIYFEDTFMGTTLIDTRVAKKELEITLGIDKNVTISRTKEKDFTTRQFIGNKKEESRIWKYTIKNNKKDAINIVVLDQIPISKTELIKIDVDTDVTKGKLNSETGEIKWNINLPAKEVASFKLKYAVKHPKNYTIHLD